MISSDLLFLTDTVVRAETKGEAGKPAGGYCCHLGKNKGDSGACSPPDSPGLVE